MQNKTLKLLNYWQQINRFSPVTVSKFKYYNPTRAYADHINTKTFIALRLNSSDEQTTSDFNDLIEKVYGTPTIEVVVGQVQHKKLYDWVDSELSDNSNNSIEPVDGDCGKSVVFYLKLNADGHYQQGSLVVSEFLRGVCSLAYPGLPEAQAIADDIRPTLLPADKPITPEHLEKVLDYIFDKLKIKDQGWRDQLCVDKYGRPAWQILLRLLPPADSKSEAILQMDFYSRDLEMLKQADLSGHYLEDFILSKPLGTRRKIDTSPEALTELTLPESHSAGKWPSKFNPTLMQKVAINIATGPNAPAVFSVNGPPGTGKTTLLKEIVANAVVEKAKILARMLAGESGLQLKRIETKTTKDHTRYYYQLPDELKSHSIVVASNNNAAVENITWDLPLAEDVKADSTYTGLFDIDEHPEVYFTSKAHDLFNPIEEEAEVQEEADWQDPTETGVEADETQEEIKVFGLVSAPCGKSKNINQIIGILPDLYTKFEDFTWDLPAKPDLKKALKDFNEALERFNKIKDSLADQVREYQDARQKLDLARSAQEKTDIEQLKKTSDLYSEKLVEVKIKKEAKERQLQSLLSSRGAQDKPASLFSKIKSVFSAADSKTSDNEVEIAKVRGQIDELRWQQESIESQFAQFNERLASYKNADGLQQDLEALKSKPIFQGVTVFDDVNFSEANITGEKAQTLCPWVNDEFNKANEALFYAALQLTKAYICNTKEIFQNLKRFVALRDPNPDHGYTAEEAASVMKEAFHTLNLLIPVLSTTFASVQRAFADFGKGELGTVIIDESGQATPYSALGLLYRSRRCIVVGDPLQVEPIFGTPSSLIRMAYNQMGLSEEEQTKFQVAGRTLSYADAAVSVQVMADACNPFYGAIGETEVGCPLVVHRRCQSPMFDISNEISYDERMINKAAPPKKDKRFALRRNEWINDEGDELGDKDHYVPSQGDKVVELMRQAQDDMGDPMLVFEPGKLYVISPFKTVAQGVRDAVEEAFAPRKASSEQPEVAGGSGLNAKAISKWAETSIGTVHTFQGKEADCVILVLGADKNVEGAARWAASQANILNVAVTRAKYRLVIIGDEKLWGKLDYFDVAYEKLRGGEQVA